MSAVARCSCGFAKGLTDYYAGKKVNCPVCQSVIVVPPGDQVYDISRLADFSGTGDIAPVSPASPQPPRHPGSNRMDAVQPTPVAYYVQPQPVRPEAYAPKTALEGHGAKPAGQFGELFSTKPDPKGMFEQKTSGLGRPLVGFLLLGGSFFSILLSSTGTGLFLSLAMLLLGSAWTIYLSSKRLPRIAGILAIIFASVGLLFSVGSIRAKRHHWQPKTKDVQVLKNLGNDLDGKLDGQRRSIEAEMRILRTSIDMWRRDNNGELPVQLNDLDHLPSFEPLLRDEWNNFYSYYRTNDGYVIKSYGADGQPGGTGANADGIATVRIKDGAGNRLDLLAIEWNGVPVTYPRTYGPKR